MEINELQHAIEAILFALGVPILGINMGRLGFLSELEPGETDLLSKLIESAAVEKAFSDSCKLKSRC